MYIRIRVYLYAVKNTYLDIPDFSKSSQEYGATESSSVYNPFELVPY